MLWYENSEFDFSWTQPQNLLILIYMSFCQCIVGHYQLVSYWLGRWQIYRRGYFPFQNSSTTKNGTTVFIFPSQSFPPKKANFVFKKSNRSWVTLSNKIFENRSLKLIKGDLEARKSFCYCAHVCGRFFAVVRLGRRRLILPGAPPLPADFGWPAWPPDGFLSKVWSTVGFNSIQGRERSQHSTEHLGTRVLAGNAPIKPGQINTYGTKEKIIRQNAHSWY